MKKLILIFVLIFTIVLTGCGSQPNDISSESDSNDQNHTASEYSNDKNTLGLEIVTNGRGKGMLLYSAGTDNGYYDSLVWVSEMYKEDSPWIHISNLVYTDYATKTRIYLCNIPGCAHNNDSCTSYIRYPRGIVLFTNSDESMLFCMATGAMDGEVYSDEDLGRIYQMNLDGTNRRELIRLKANESFSLSDPVLSDEANIYVCVVVTKNATTEPTKEFRKISIANGVATTLLSLKQRELVTSVYDDVVVITDYTNENKTIYNGFSLNQNKMQKLYEGEADSLGAENYLFFATKHDDNTGTLKIVDLKSGSEKTIENIPQDAVGDILLADYYDDMVHWHYIDALENGNPHEYTINIETGTIVKKTLMYIESNSTDRMVHIVGEVDDSFLVIMGTEDSSLTLTDREGIPHVYDFPDRPVYALMDKEDYWNNNPNYSKIDDTI